MQVSVGDYVTTMPRDDQDRKGKIRTYTGRYVDPLNLQPDDINILDIAHHLSNLCRYTGACPEFYSVAQHSEYVSRLMENKFRSADAALAGLLHDAAEAYFNDIASPVKHDPRMQWYADLEHAATQMIFRKFGLDPAWLLLTKEADNLAFHREAKTWWGTDPWWGKDPWVMPVAPAEAKLRFVQRFNELHSQRSS